MGSKMKSFAQQVDETIKSALEKQRMAAMAKRVARNVPRSGRLTEPERNTC